MFTTAAQSKNNPIYKLFLDDLSVVISLANFKMASINFVDEQASLKCIRVEYTDGTEVIILSRTALFQKHIRHFLTNIFCIVSGVHIEDVPGESDDVADLLIEEFSL